MSSVHVKYRKIHSEDLHYDDTFLERGTYGDVKKAKWQGKDVAVKLFSCAEKKGGFSEELVCLSMLHEHANIVDLYGAHLGDSMTDRPFLVLEFAPHSLEKVLHISCNDLRYTVDHVMSWSLQMAIALEFIHSKEMLHRDVKPSNILLFEDGRVLKLCDFGTARKLQHTLTNAVGTAWYMAPEVVRGTYYTPSCDVYSFGVVLWEMITRHKPYLAGTQAKGLAPQSVMYRVATGSRPPMICELPKCLEELIKRCWDEASHKRPSTLEIKTKLEKLTVLAQIEKGKPFFRQRQPKKSESEPTLHPAPSSVAPPPQAEQVAERVSAPQNSPWDEPTTVCHSSSSSSTPVEPPSSDHTPSVTPPPPSPAPSLPPPTSTSTPLPPQPSPLTASPPLEEQQVRPSRSHTCSSEMVPTVSCVSPLPPHPSPLTASPPLEEQQVRPSRSHTCSSAMVPTPSHPRVLFKQQSSPIPPPPPPPLADSDLSLSFPQGALSPALQQKRRRADPPTPNTSGNTSGAQFSSGFPSPYSLQRPMSHQDSNMSEASMYIEREEEEEGPYYGQMQQWFQKVEEEVKSGGLENDSQTPCVFPRASYGVSRYAIPGLEEEWQPVIPDPNDPDSIHCYEEFKEVAQQVIRTKQDIVQLSEMNAQVDREISSDEKKLGGNRSTREHFHTLLKQKDGLVKELQALQLQLRTMAIQN